MYCGSRVLCLSFPLFFFLSYSILMESNEAESTEVRTRRGEHVAEDGGTEEKVYVL